MDLRQIRRPGGGNIISARNFTQKDKDFMTKTLRLSWPDRMYLGRNTAVGERTFYDLAEYSFGYFTRGAPEQIINRATERITFMDNKVTALKLGNKEFLPEWEQLADYCINYLVGAIEKAELAQFKAANKGASEVSQETIDFVNSPFSQTSAELRNRYRDQGNRSRQQDWHARTEGEPYAGKMHKPKQVQATSRKITIGIINAAFGSTIEYTKGTKLESYYRKIKIAVNASVDSDEELPEVKRKLKNIIEEAAKNVDGATKSHINEAVQTIEAALGSSRNQDGGSARGGRRGGGSFIR